MWKCENLKFENGIHNICSNVLQMNWNTYCLDLL